MTKTSQPASVSEADPTRRRQMAVVWFSAATLAILALVTCLAALQRPLAASQPVTGVSLFIILSVVAMVALLALAWTYTAWANREDRRSQTGGEWMR